MNFKGIILLTTTHAARSNMLTASLATAMANVREATFIVMHYGRMDPAVRKTLCIMAEGTDNNVLVNEIDENISVANTKRLFRAYPYPSDWRLWVNLDDDVITHYNTWDAICKRSWAHDVHTVGVVDANNARNYVDFDRVRYLNYAAYIAAGMPEDKAKVHYFKSVVTIPYKWLSNLYAMHREVLEADRVWLPIEEQFAVKGIRGYDIALEKRLTDLCFSIGYTTGCEATHIGMEESYLNSNWKGVDNVVHERVQLNGQP